MDITYEIAKADFDYRASRAREQRNPSPRPRRHLPRVRRPFHLEQVS
jgi:hypothetical protein